MKKSTTVFESTGSFSHGDVNVRYWRPLSGLVSRTSAEVQVDIARTIRAIPSPTTNDIMDGDEQTLLAFAQQAAEAAELSAIEVTWGQYRNIGARLGVVVYRDWP